MKPHRSMLLAALLGTILAAPALAQGQSEGEGDGECRTWFPDFDRDCQREFRFPGFVAPMSMPYLFEDPFVTTGAQFVGIWHDFSDPGSYDGGQAAILALQLRVAITDRLAFIATKDGFVIYRPETEQSDTGLNNSGRELIKDEEGFTDMTIGFKYSLLEMPEHNFILSPAFRYEIPLGDRDVLQGQGDGVFIPSASFAWGLGEFGLDKLHIIGSFGGQIAIDTDKDSDSIFYNLHVDYALFDHFVPFMEMNGLTWVRSGDGSANLRTTLGKVSVRAAQDLTNSGRWEGADYTNLGSSGMKNETLFTLSWGARIPVNRNLSFGAQYERAVEGRKNSFRQRVTAMATFEF